MRAVVAALRGPQRGGGGGGVEKAEGGFHFAACLAFREQLLDGARVMQLVAGNGLLKQPHNVRYQH
jgi:hypothetical protein